MRATSCSIRSPLTVTFRTRFADGSTLTLSLARLPAGSRGRRTPPRGAAVVGRRVDVVGRVERRTETLRRPLDRRRVDRAVAEPFLDRGGAEGYGIDAPDRHPRGPAAADRRGRRDDVRPVLAEWKGRESVTRAVRRRGSEIVVRSSPSPDGRQVDAEEEGVRGDGSHAARADDRERRVESDEQRGQMVRRVVDADVAADRSAVSHLDVGDRGRDLGQDGSVDVDPRIGDQRRTRSPSRRARGRRHRRIRSHAAPRDLRGRRARRERATRAFMTLTSVCPPARARAPSWAPSSATASSTVVGRAYSTSRRSMGRFSHSRCDMSRTYRLSYSRAVAPFDAVFVGSGINGLAGAALLARDGWSVCVLEREERLGGCIYTSAAVTLPGYTHELLASWHPLFTGSAAYAELQTDLDATRARIRQHRPADRDCVPGRVCSVRHHVARGQHRPGSTGSQRATARPGSASSRSSWATPSSRSGSSRPSSGRAQGSRSAVGPTEARPDGSRRVHRPSARQLSRLARPRRSGHPKRTACSRPGCSTPVSGPDQATSGFMTQVIAAAFQLGGMPVPVGGGVRLVDALAAMVTDADGEVRTGADVERVLVAGGKATAVRLAGGETILGRTSSRASRRRSCTAGCCGDGDIPAPRRGRRPPVPLRPRRDADPPRARRAAVLGRERSVGSPRADTDRSRHAGARRVSKAVNEAERGLLPVEATIVCGQPCALDSSRAPDGESILWIQLQELPAGPVQGRRGRRTGHGRRQLDGGSAGGVRRPGRGAARPADHEPRRRRSDPASCSRRRTSSS